jgi:hypothetical protein
LRNSGQTPLASDLLSKRIDVKEYALPDKDGLYAAEVYFGWKFSNGKTANGGT